MSYNLIIILGPTATGKTKLGAKLAYAFNGEIISADSRQVYKTMDIGTGKDLGEYTIENINIPYHLIDIIEPFSEFDLFKFNTLFYESYNDINQSKKLPFLVGGTSLYLYSIIKGYNLAPVDFESEEYIKLSCLSIEELKEIILNFDTKLHNTTDLIDKERMIKSIIIHNTKTSGQHNTNPLLNPLIIGVQLPLEVIKQRITERLQLRLNNGMIDEVNQLIKNGVTLEKLLFFGLEYKYIGLYLFNQLNYNDMYQKLNSAIYQFARKQIKWFRKMEREGVKIKLD